jgi:ribosome-associated protein
MSTAQIRRQVAQAIAACQSKKAENLTVLEMDAAAAAFTDYFVLCTGLNPRQIQAISDEVEEKLKKAGLRPTHVEGYQQAEWVLLDYVDFVVHVFSERARNYYDLERLWKSARRLDPVTLAATPRKRAGARRAAKPRKAASRRRR